MAYENKQQAEIDALKKKRDDLTNQTYTPDADTTAKLDSAKEGLASALNPTEFSSVYDNAISEWEQKVAGGTQNEYSNPYASQIAEQEQKVKDLSGNTEYQSALADTIAQKRDELQNSKFEWDPDTDAEWQTLRRQYLMEADRTASDTLAKSAASTGGVASSYAVSAASQAANYYKAQLSTAQQAAFDSAYARYKEEYSRKQSELEELKDQDDTDYARWLQKSETDYARANDELDYLTTKDDTAYSRWNNEDEKQYERDTNYLTYLTSQRSNEYNEWRQNNSDAIDRAATLVSLYQTDADTDYERWWNERNTLFSEMSTMIDELTDEEREAYDRWYAGDETAYNRMSDNWTKLYTAITTSGYEPTAAELEEAGMSSGMAAMLRAAYYTNLYSSVGTSGGSGGSGDSSGSYGSSYDYDTGTGGTEETYTVNGKTMTYSDIAEAASQYVLDNPSVKADSRTLAVYLEELGYTGDAKQAFTDAVAYYLVNGEQTAYQQALTEQPTGSQNGGTSNTGNLPEKIQGLSVNAQQLYSTLSNWQGYSNKSDSEQQDTISKQLLNAVSSGKVSSSAAAVIASQLGVNLYYSTLPDRVKSMSSYVQTVYYNLNSGSMTQDQKAQYLYAQAKSGGLTESEAEVLATQLGCSAKFQQLINTTVASGNNNSNGYTPTTGTKNTSNGSAAAATKTTENTKQTTKTDSSNKTSTTVTANSTLPASIQKLSSAAQNWYKSYSTKGYTTSKLNSMLNSAISSKTLTNAEARAIASALGFTLGR